MIKRLLSTITFLTFFFANSTCGQFENDNASLDVLSYHLQLQPHILEKYIEGNVIINFSINSDASEVVFNCGNLHINEIRGEVIESYIQKDQKLIIILSDKIAPENEIQIFYQGSPSRGVVFNSDPLQMHTVFFTSEWMVCNDTPDDKAKVNIDLLISGNLTCIASGIFTSKEEMRGDLLKYSWSQDVGTPSYTYGFAIGTFTEFRENHNGVWLNYYSPDHSKQELESIFDKTSDMLSFFEEKSGMPYFQKSYSQVLIGNHYQEMSGFSVLKNSYGELVLKDSTETNLIAHELAHQWWGNMITCANWNHFWLNEGFATFMSAAYNEHRFGKAKYESNIESYYSVYEKIKNKGADKSLVFEDWSSPNQDDRNLVYFKGAYVLHLLRAELGDLEFWKGIKSFSQKYYGKSVSTRDFQDAMEKSTNKNLDSFFDAWVY